MNNRLWYAITMRNAMQCFRQGKVTGTSTIDANMAQKLAGVCHEPILQVFLDVWKAYNSLDRGI